jgi:hypothetical protein
MWTGGRSSLRIKMDARANSGGTGSNPKRASEHVCERLNLFREWEPHDIAAAKLGHVETEPLVIAEGESVLPRGPAPAPGCACFGSAPASGSNVALRNPELGREKGDQLFVRRAVHGPCPHPNLERPLTCPDDGGLLRVRLPTKTGCSHREATGPFIDNGHSLTDPYVFVGEQPRLDEKPSSPDHKASSAAALQPRQGGERNDRRRETPRSVALAHDRERK